MAIGVIGRFPGYIRVSDYLGARRLDIDPVIWNPLDRATQWAANKYFLDTMLAAGDRFVWETDPRLARPGSFFFREVHYLRLKGVPFPTRQVWVS